MEEKIMKYKNILVVNLLLTPFLTKADTSCIGITSINPVTFVSEQHPLGFVNCACNCSSSQHLEDSTCITCNHKHASSQVIQTAKTNGHFVNFMPPAQAVTSSPTSPSADWIEALIGYIKTKKMNTILPPTEVSFPFSESKKK
jgi:hypothetical protein